MKVLTHWTLAFVTVIVVTLFHYNDNYVVETARLKSFDLLQQSDELVHSSDIGIVTIDEKALEKYGQWPWKRSILAGIIWELRQADVGIIVLPILFSEYDRLDGDQELTKNAAIQVQFMQSNGSTAATTTAGAGVIAIHYNYV